MSEVRAVATHRYSHLENQLDNEGTVDVHVQTFDGSILVGVTGNSPKGFLVAHCWISFENLEKLVDVCRQVRQHAQRPDIMLDADAHRASNSTFEVHTERF